MRASGLSFSLEQDAIRNVGKLSDSGHFREKPYRVGLTSGSATEAGHRAGAVCRGSAEKKEHRRGGAPTRTKAKTPPSEGRRYKDRRVQASCRSPKDGSQLEGAEFEWFGNFLRAVASNLIAKVCVDRLRGKDWPG